MKNINKRIYCSILFAFMAIQSYSQSEQILATSSIKKSVPLIEAVIKEDEKVDDVKPTFTLSGSIDTYFHSTFKTTNSYYGDAYASSTSFADQKGFALGMVNLI